LQISLSLTIHVFQLLPIAKTGINQRVVLREPDVERLLQLYVRTVGPLRRAYIFPSDGLLRAHFLRSCSELKLDQRFVFHSLRHGHATSDHLAGASMKDIMIRGRWKSLDSARTYVQAGAAIAMGCHIPRIVAETGLRISNDLYNYFIYALTQKH
jgi:integrase